jgi:hypothetical protein
MPRTRAHIHDLGHGITIFYGRDAIAARVGEVTMPITEYSRKLDELDRLLNDPDVPMQPDRIWSLLADVSRPPPSSIALSGSPER